MHGTHSAARPFREHLEELRGRLMLVALTLCAGTGVGYGLHRQIFNLLRKPLRQQLYYTSPIGGFNAMLKISILFGIVLSIPVLMYQTVQFLAPAFRKNVAAKPGRIVFFSVFLASIGVAFAYYVSLPAALKFLTNLDTTGLQPFIVVNDYLNFVLYYLAGFALLFQLPLILLLINRVTPLTPKKLLHYERYVILFSFIIAAILTPTPDPVNQTIMALPTIILYQFSVLVVLLKRRRHPIWDAAVEPSSIAPAPELAAVASAVSMAPMDELFASTPVATSIAQRSKYMDIMPPQVSG